MDIQAVEKLVELIKKEDDIEVRNILLDGLVNQLSTPHPRPGVVYPYPMSGGAIPCGYDPNKMDVKLYAGTNA